METKEIISARISEIQVRMEELSETRREMAIQMAVEVGTNEEPGIAIDPLTKWARQIKNVNTEMKALAEERRFLRERRQLLTPCTCTCH